MLEIDPISAASPDLSGPSFDALKASIARHGRNIYPIVIQTNRIIDGRKRYRACHELGIEPYCIRIADDADGREFARTLNLDRTHDTPSQKAMYGAKLAALAHGSNQFQLKSQAKAGEKVDGYDISTHSAAPLSNEQAAGIAGIAAITVKKARQVRREAAPEVTAAVERGELSLYAAQKIVAGTPKEEQAARLAEVLTARRGASGRMVPGTLKSVVRQPRQPGAAAQIEKSITLMEHAAAVAEPHLDMDLSQWAERAARLEKFMRRFRRRVWQREPFPLSTRDTSGLGA
jgi:ParB-like chromosome segregation protein Spo0J